MEIINAKAKQYGLKNFDKHSSPINYVTMKNLQEYPSPPKEYLNKLKHLTYQELKNNDKERVFLYGEFIKRKFYIDCLYTRKQSKRKFNYINNTFNSDEDCFNYISDTFILEEDRLNFYMRRNNCHKSFIDSFANYNYNIYSIIKNNFDNNLDVLKKLISTPEIYCNRKKLDDDDIEFLKHLSNKTDYLYERILYGINPLQPYKRKTIEYYNNEFANILRILNNSFGSYFDDCFLMLYRYIIDKYSLYMSDLFNIVDMVNIIHKQYNFTDCSHFFFIPSENGEQEFIKECVDINTDDKNKNITIKIKLVNDIDSLRIVDYVSRILIETLYSYKENHGLRYSDDEISYFINKFDSSKKHNKSNFISRINGLYIWDKVYINKVDLSIHCICTNFNKKFPDRKGKKVKPKDDIVYLQRCYKAIENSIETLSFYRLK